MKPNFIKPKFKIHLPKKVKESIEGLSIDWRQYLPTPEDQKWIFDSECCMTYSAIHIIETKLNQMKKLGQIPQAVIDKCASLGYFDENSNFAFSVRFSAILNGTTPSAGNSFDPVWKSFKTFGLLPKRDFNFTMADAQKDPTEQIFWSDYFNPSHIMQEMKDKALIFNTMFLIDYTWIISSGINGVLMKAYNFITGQNDLGMISSSLQSCPVHIAIYPCAGWNTGTVPYCGTWFAQHGVELFGVNGDNSFSIFDTYNPFTKKLGSGYVIPYAVVPKISMIQKPIYTFYNNLAYAQFSREVNMLQSCLKYLGYFSGDTTNYYGDKTSKSVLAFQTDQGINPTSEKNVGPLTRAALNSLFSK